MARRQDLQKHPTRHRTGQQDNQQGKQPAAARSDHGERLVTGNKDR
jgi:hypothetical protein